MAVMPYIGVHLAGKFLFELEGPSFMSAGLCR